MILDKKFIALRLPKRPKDSNKGTYGKVLVIAGSKNYPGAAYLACAAAYRIGAGLVSLITSFEVKNIVSRKLPELTFLNKPSKDYDVLLFGPGLGKNADAKFINFLETAVIDGDGLRFFEGRKKPAVLTPHPGEMAKMTGLSISQIQANREKIAQEFARIWQQVLVLKGANTLVVSPAGEMKVANFANPLLSTAGTGDILSGIIAGLIAQGLNNFDASCVGVYLHGLAAEMLKEKLGDRGMLASDLLPMLAKATQHIQTSNQSH